MLSLDQKSGSGIPIFFGLMAYNVLFGHKHEYKLHKVLAEVAIKKAE